MPNFMFDEAAHIYKLDGVVLPGVSNILRGSGIESGYYPEKGRDVYLDRGKKIHTACHLLVTGGLDWDDLDVRIRGYAKSFERLLIEGKYKIIVSEWRGFSTVWHFAGTLDLVLWLKNERVIVDIKSGVNIPVSTAIQTAGYQILWNEINPTKPVSGRYGVQLFADGSFPKIKEFRDPSDMDTFKAARTVYSWRIRNDKKDFS